ncbi:MAG: efflux RND transporter periplasmic adaptor subunit [Planctomycetes bacterium]|nr:efflux RND transporter periplasmic adaptor subunit [Planctomycetota bacterium]
MHSVPLRLALICAATLTACGGSPKEDEKDSSEQAPPTLVRTAPVEVRSVRRTVETTSYIEAEHRVTVLSKVTGRVVEVLVDEGMKVESGAVLARLDDREAVSAVRQAEILLEDAKVRLDLAKLESDASSHRVGQARVERDRAQATHDRNRELSEGLIAEREIEESGYAVEAAVEALRVAEFEERKARLEVEAAKNTVAERQSKLDDAKIELSEHTIHAPFDGIVESRLVRGGETISLSTELFVVLDPTRLVSYLRRPQRELGLIRDASEVVFETDAWPDREFHASIDVVSPVIDATNGSFKIRIRVAATDAHELRPGMFVRARILTEDSRDAAMVPKSAVLNERNESVVFVIRGGKAVRLRIDPGLEEIDHLEVLNRGVDGLRDDDVVVISGHRDLRDQAAVEVVS